MSHSNLLTAHYLYQNLILIHYKYLLYISYRLLCNRYNHIIYYYLHMNMSYRYFDINNMITAVVSLLNVL